MMQTRAEAGAGTARFLRIPAIKNPFPKEGGISVNY